MTRAFSWFDPFRQRDGVMILAAMPITQAGGNYGECSWR
jgi:hypothetical protein